MNLESINSYLDKIFQYDKYPESAINGIQIANDGKVSKIAVAVDFSVQLLEKAIQEKVNLLITHHGIYWGQVFPITGRYYQLISKAIQNNIALISIHLPLDIHEKYGNNSGIINTIKSSGLTFKKRFGDYEGMKILFEAEYQKTISFQKLLKIVHQKIGKPLYSLEVNPKVKKIAICSGGGLFGIEQAVKNGCDTFITGDINHIAYHQCKELNINLISGGHYQTEVFGVQSIAELLEKKWKIKVPFYDIPTHL